MSPRPAGDLLTSSSVCMTRSSFTLFSKLICRPWHSHESSTFQSLQVLSHAEATASVICMRRYSDARLQRATSNRLIVDWNGTVRANKLCRSTGLATP